MQAWLEAQTALGLVETVDAPADPARYRLATDLDELRGPSEGMSPFRRCLW